MAFRVDYLVKETGRNFLRNPSLTVATIITVSISLSLIGSFLLVTQAVGQVRSSASQNIELIVWLKTGLEDEPSVSADLESTDTDAENSAETAVSALDSAAIAETRDRIQKALDDSTLVKKATYKSKEENFLLFSEQFENSPGVVALASPESLPASFDVVPVSADASTIEELRSMITNDIQGVRFVSTPDETIKNFIKFSTVSSQVMLATAILAVLASALLMYNSIRTAVFARRKEIEVMRLVGATKWFIRIPFMFEALLQGVLGALVSIISVVGLNIFGLKQVEELKKVYEGIVVVGFSGVLLISLGLILIGAVLGASAAGIAVSKYLDA